MVATKSRFQSLSRPPSVRHSGLMILRPRHIARRVLKILNDNNN